MTEKNSVLGLLLDSHAWFKGERIRVALIGGMALSRYGYVRNTLDVDWLIHSDDEERKHTLLVSKGFACLQRSQEVSCYLRQSARLDFLHAHRVVGRTMLSEAVAKTFEQTMLPVLRAEDIIGLKAQAAYNDPARLHRDFADIGELLRVNHKTLDLARIESYFAILNHADDWEKLKATFAAE